LRADAFYPGAKLFFAAQSRKEQPNMRKKQWLTLLMASVLIGLPAATGAQQQDIGADPAPPQVPPLDQNLAPPTGTTQSDATQSPAAAQPGFPSPAAPERSLIRGDQAQPAQLGDEGQSGASDAQRGELGVWLAPTDGPGVRVRRVAEGSAAQQAGLEPGDILMQINGRWASTPESVASMVREIPVGQNVSLQIWRDGQAQEISATIAPMDEASRVASADDQEYSVGFRGGSAGQSNDLAQRVMTLERQLGMVTQQLQQLSQQMMQSNSAGTASAPGAMPPGATPGAGLDATSPGTPGSASQDATTPSGTEQPGQTPSSDLDAPASDAAQPQTNPTGTESGVQSGSGSDSFLD
jgi:membrane-associated protease RseP (regulator of RpoE activity)